MKDQAANFLFQCKENYFKKITPSNLEVANFKEYKSLVKIAQEYFAEGKYEEFANFLQEGQYFVALWAAHLIIDFGKPDKIIEDKALEIIKDYSTHPLFLEVAEEEKNWINKNKLKFKNLLS